MTPLTQPFQLLAELDRLGIGHSTVEHPPVHTVEEARRLRGNIPGGHAKNLFLHNGRGALYLAVTLEETAVDLKSLAKEVGAGRFSFAAPELLRETLGVEPGSVTPFALVNDRAHKVTVLLDTHMLARTPLSFHPLQNTATTSIAAADLPRFVRAQGHEPFCLPFPQRTAPGIT